MRYFSDRRQRDQDALNSASTLEDDTAESKSLRDRIECMYYEAMDNSDHWAGFSHAFYIHGTPVILAMLQAIDSARTDESFLNSLNVLRSDVFGCTVYRRTLGQQTQTYASMLRLILHAQENCAIVHQHVDKTSVVDEIFRLIPVTCAKERQIES